jgi:hypothetical protein
MAAEQVIAMERILRTNMERARQQIADPATDQRLKDLAQEVLDAAEALIHPPIKPPVFNSDVFNNIMKHDPDAAIQPHELYILKKATKVIQWAQATVNTRRGNNRNTESAWKMHTKRTSVGNPSAWTNLANKSTSLHARNLYNEFGSDSPTDTASTNRTDRSQVALSPRPERAQSQAPTSRAFQQTLQWRDTYDRLAQSRPVP